MTAQLITIDEAKTHLRVADSNSDTDIAFKLDLAEKIVLEYIGATEIEGSVFAGRFDETTYASNPHYPTVDLNALEPDSVSNPSVQVYVNGVLQSQNSTGGGSPADGSYYYDYTKTGSPERQSVVFNTGDEPDVGSDVAIYVNSLTVGTASTFHQSVIASILLVLTNLYDTRDGQTEVLSDAVKNLLRRWRPLVIA